MATSDNAVINNRALTLRLAVSEAAMSGSRPARSGHVLCARASFQRSAQLRRGIDRPGRGCSRSDARTGSAGGIGRPGGGAEIRLVP